MGTLIKNKHYYDNTYKVSNGILSIDRIYKVDEYAFKDGTYDELARIYRNLPEFIFNPTQLCCWFGDKDAGDEYYLYVSFEPSGLQFIGNLSEDSFNAWEEEFHKEIIRVPFRKR